MVYYYCCYVLVMRVAGILCGESSKSKSVGKNWVMGISVGIKINRGAGRIMRVNGICGFVRFVSKGRVCKAVCDSA